MVIIQKIRTNSRSGDTSALLALMLKAFANNDWSTDIYLTPIIEKISLANTQLIEALKRLKVYSQLAEKDRMRNMSIRALFKLVEGYDHMPIAEIKEAASVVNNILEQYGLRILKESYTEKSASIESLLNDLSKADVVLAKASLQGVPETITSLDTAQKDFENLALQQTEQESVKKNLQSASQLKKEIITEINTNLVGYMNTMAKVNPVTYTDIAHTIAELIDTNNELVKRRRKKDEPEELNKADCEHA
ncbi:DUF6261 family protein [Ancylomarina sp. 16SWW S1-10-2]|uniref:DUF6261 family protein n=1 Tax=Ancylomarina sp. 16SWW S1-10-2 TaxID=2499681 RepID=UPI0012AE35C5|nr:DUF6261 family protein [Ancylomarina sp. 16SWW S1-10-2]MRT92812.1 hypothetical protein [Ancylomarina sp. 16SWW S1-10-2]